MTNAMTDGDALFAAAVLGSARGREPRGAALNALCDWLTERFQGGAEAVALADPLSGIGLTIFCRPGQEFPFRCHYAAEDNDDDGTDIGVLRRHRSLDDAGPAGEISFYRAFHAEVQRMWKGEQS